MMTTTSDWNARRTTAALSRQRVASLSVAAVVMIDFANKSTAAASVRRAWVGSRRAQLAASASEMLSVLSDSGHEESYYALVHPLDDYNSPTTLRGINASFVCGDQNSRIARPLRPTLPAFLSSDGGPCAASSLFRNTVAYVLGLWTLYQRACVRYALHLDNDIHAEAPVPAYTPSATWLSAGVAALASNRAMLSVGLMPPGRQPSCAPAVLTPGAAATCVCQPWTQRHLVVARATPVRLTHGRVASVHDAAYDSAARNATSSRLPQIACAYTLADPRRLLLPHADNVTAGNATGTFEVATRRASDGAPSAAEGGWVYFFSTQAFVLDLWRWDAHILPLVLPFEPPGKHADPFTAFPPMSSHPEWLITQAMWRRAAFMHDHRKQTAPAPGDGPHLAAPDHTELVALDQWFLSPSDVGAHKCIVLRCGEKGVKYQKSFYCGKQNCSGEDALWRLLGSSEAES